MEEIWEDTFRGVTSYGAYGPRDVLIICPPSESLEGQDIVPRRKGVLTQEDKDRLASQGILEECWEDDVKLMEARFGKEGQRYTLLPKENGEGLSCQGVMERIRSVMKNTTKPGVFLYYIGAGKKDTGDWCFQDGFIDFNDIIETYMECFQSKCLEVSSDCSYSGKWVRDCAYFLDEVGVQPCGHSSRKENVLLKVGASCLSHEVPHTLLFSARGRGNDKETGLLYIHGNGHEVEQGQHISWLDNTDITCRKHASFADACLLASDYTWEKDREGRRVHLVRGRDCGWPCWHYVMVNDDEETQQMFQEKVKSGHMDVADYGYLIKSGWGRDPPRELQESVKRRRHNNTYY